MDAPGVLHHLMGRGIERREIFLSDIDCNDFIGRLSSLAQDEAMEIYAWVLMPKHFHLLCKTKKELVGGGLIRSMGGWSAVFDSRRRGEREVADQRILGDGDFVKQVISGLDDLVKKNLRLSGQRIDIKALAEKVSERYNVSMGELRSGGRRRAVVKARRTMSWIGVRELGYSGADVCEISWCNELLRDTNDISREKTGYR